MSVHIIIICPDGCLEHTYSISCNIKHSSVCLQRQGLLLYIELNQYFEGYNPIISTMADKDATQAGFQEGIKVRRNDEYGRLQRQHNLHKTALENRLIRAPLPSD